MELFLDFFCTIVFSLFSSFLLAKLFSVVSAYDDDLEKRTVRDQKFQRDFEDYGFGKETRFGLVSEIAGDVSIENKILAQQEFSKLQYSTNSYESVLKLVETLDLVEEVSDQQKELETFYLKLEGYGERVECGYRKKSFGGSCKREIEMGLVNEEVGVERSEDIEIIENEEVGGEIEEDKDDDGDWEGIERSELERLFGAAVAYVGSGMKKSSLRSDLKLQLYGLHRVAIEGPCLVPQPNALKVSARAKWNAWQQLGNMSPEAAMEQYINLVCRNIPGWMKDDNGENVQQIFADNAVFRNLRT